MHDISAAQIIAEEVIKKIKGKDIKKIEISVVLGLLRYHNIENVKFYIEEILKKELGDLEIKIDIHIAKPKIECECGFKGSLEHVKDSQLFHYGIHDISCPACNSNKIKINGGNECLIKRIRAR
ncbi:MAG TPA: hypothetical protein ENG42_03765 [Candidatus Aenigmarchaeota archaeon]|nr:MAG: hypothetical protein DRP03_00730 [Candidatus Aenigmarchaeota archaeon]HDD46569.1 hypothetical protein [Candidatus Aenigmarchaeota archaeon]